MMLQWLENWFDSQCNGDWEHGYGIKIESIDNPGWEITIELDGIYESINEITWDFIGDFDNKWIGYKIENNKFNGACSPKNLNLLISVFKDILEKGVINHKNVEKELK